jgi:hypothetical protein
VRRRLRACSVELTCGAQVSTKPSHTSNSNNASAFSTLVPISSASVDYYIITVPLASHPMSAAALSIAIDGWPLLPAGNVVKRQAALKIDWD